MIVEGSSVLVTGGASGLGLAVAKRMLSGGAAVVLFDLPSSKGEDVAAQLGHGTQFVSGDVTNEEQVSTALTAAQEIAPLRAAIHCAGRGGSHRIVDREKRPYPQQLFDDIVRVNLQGSFNVLRLSAARMMENDLVDQDRGVVVLTASAAAYEGQIGQAAYAASKGGVVSLTLCAARDLASQRIRVCTIAPGLMDTPMLGKLPDDVKDGLAESVCHPKRLGDPEEYAQLAAHIVENPYLNGETIRLDGAIRMPPRS